MDDEWNEEQLEAPDSPNIIEDQDEASSHKRSRESSESAPNEPEKRNEDNTEQGANDSAQTLKVFSLSHTQQFIQILQKIKYAAVMEPVYRYREQCYRQAYALQMQRQQASIQRFNTNVVKHIDSMNRICQTWRPKVVATTEAFLNRFNKSKRERLKLEESLNHRFMIVGYRPLESRVLLSRTKTDQSDQSSRLGDIDNNDEEQWKDECLLIPIRIEVEAEGQRFRDTFTWNAHGK